ncbi:hypothetical protein K438DRAFT_1966292 [Mycena galopus ATCC 62051]|nr:hypothetical protein K438DRAFT_1966292 [Mycena galopus ATCC 62051]
MAMIQHRLNPSPYASATDSDLAMHSRNYSYPPPGFSGDNASPPSSAYSPSYEQSSGRPYYPAPSTVRVGHQSSQYYPPIAPAPPSSSSYRSSAEYSSPSGYPSTQYPDSRGSGYSSHPPGSYPFNARAASPAPGSYHRQSSTQPPPRNFIPTPSEAYANPSRPPRPSSAMHGPSSRAGYSSTPHASPLGRVPGAR